jgi:hypothetical protein
VTVACLAVVSALFVAHLGAEGHSDECHACEIAAHAAAIEAPTVEALAPLTTTLVEQLAGTDAPLPGPPASCSPRAPPTA